MSSRRKAREAVLKVLYLIESREISVDAAFCELEAVDIEIKAGHLAIAFHSAEAEAALLVETPAGAVECDNGLYSFITEEDEPLIIAAAEGSACLERPEAKEMCVEQKKMLVYDLKKEKVPRIQAVDPDIHRVWTKLGWPYTTALAMTRLVYGGVMEKLPGLQVVTHHCGGLIPFLASRIDWNDDFNEMRMGHRDIYLKEKALNYYRRFFFDTAVNGNTAALQCGLSFAGIDQLVFATDMPFDNQMGRRLIRDTIESVEQMGLDEADKRKVYRDNAIKLLRLPVGAV